MSNDDTALLAWHALEEELPERRSAGRGSPQQRAYNDDRPGSGGGGS